MSNINNCIKGSRGVRPSAHRHGGGAGNTGAAWAPWTLWDSRRWPLAPEVLDHICHCPMEHPQRPLPPSSQRASHHGDLQSGTWRCSVDQNWKPGCDFRGPLTVGMFVCVCHYSLNLGVTNKLLGHRGPLGFCVLWDFSYSFESVKTICTVLGWGVGSAGQFCCASHGTLPQQ